MKAERSSRGTRPVRYLRRGAAGCGRPGAQRGSGDGADRPAMRQSPAHHQQGYQHEEVPSPPSQGPPPQQSAYARPAVTPASERVRSVASARCGAFCPARRLRCRRLAASPPPAPPLAPALSSVAYAAVHPIHRIARTAPVGAFFMPHICAVRPDHPSLARRAAYLRRGRCARHSRHGRHSRIAAASCTRRRGRAAPPRTRSTAGDAPAAVGPARPGRSGASQKSYTNQLVNNRHTTC